MTKFEEDLKAYFPDVYRLHELSKDEPYLWDLVEVLLEFKINKESGFIRINYSGGSMSAVLKMIDIVASKKKLTK